MKQSQKLFRLQTILSESETLRRMLSAISEIAAQYHDFCAEGFSQSQHLQWLITEMEKLRMPELTHLLDSLRQPDSIIALPIKVDSKFTLFFVVVPAGGSFGWHSHPRMSGLSKCLHGELVVSTLDIHRFQPEGGSLLYPKNQMRKEYIRGWGHTVSTIEPHNYNIHRIDAPIMSAFFDLLMPDYPENTCQFYETSAEDANLLKLDEIGQPKELVRGWDQAILDLSQSQKQIKRNFILQ